MVIITVTIIGIGIVTMRAKLLQCLGLFATPWTVAHQAPLSKRFSRQEYWSGVPFPPPGDLPDPGINSSDSGSCGGDSDGRR